MLFLDGNLKSEFNGQDLVGKSAKFCVSKYNFTIPPKVMYSTTLYICPISTMSLFSFHTLLNQGNNKTLFLFY